MDQPHISAGTEILKLVNYQNPFPETKNKDKVKDMGFRHCKHPNKICRDFDWILKTLKRTMGATEKKKAK
jgi:hypothetical protein